MARSKDFLQEHPGVVVAVRCNGMRALPITEAHAAATATLPALHADPFDRLLVVQARLEGIALLCADERVLAYGDGVRRL